MLTRLTRGIIAGLAAALIAGITEGLLGDHGPLPAAIVTAWGLLAPAGLMLGAGLVIISSLLPDTMRPRALLLSFSSPDNPDLAGATVAVGTWSLLLLAVIYRIIFFFMSGFHHRGLAAMSLAVTLLIFSAAVVLVGKNLARWGAILFGRAPSFARRPAVALVAVVILWSAVLSPPLMKGPEATGVYGFFGLLRKDGLGAGPLMSILGMGLVASALIVPLERLKGRALLVTGLAVLILGLTGPLLSARTILANPDGLDRIDSAGGLSPLVAKVIRRFGDGDGDGHAKWMGGLDCDDSDPAIHPGARDVPDNGVDEDCSGGDLSIASLEAAAGEKGVGDKAEDENVAGHLARPVLPEDVSLFLITVDTLRWNEPGFMGYERPVTNNLDALVENGTIYERGYALGSYTGQAIPPILTGKYASELNRNDRHETRIAAREKFAAEYVCKKGTRCGAVLSHFLFTPSHGWSQGFDHWEVAPFSPPGPVHRDLKYNSHTVANRAIKWLKDPKNTEGRFWLWTHFMDPHKEYIRHEGFKSFGDERRDMYDHEVLFTDYHIGKMLDYFRTLPAFDRTVFIVTADHGEAFNEHGRWCHGKELWEEIIRVPLAVAGPGIAKKRIDRQTSQIDLFPTILDLFGKEIPEGTHGRSLLPDWVEGQQLRERPVIADQPRNPFYETRRVYIRDGWKLHDLPDSGTHRLYRITDDFERGESLVEKEPEAFARIKAAYDLFMAKEFDPIPAVKYSTGPIEEMPLPPGVKR